MGIIETASSVDCLVIGAGVIGLAVARRLAMAGNEVVVAESEAATGTQTSSRNSEIIHAGIYYPDGSLKARHCVAGKQALYRFCTTHGIDHRRCGKLIVATSEDQLPHLESLRKQAARNGVFDLEWRSSVEVREMEPAVSCVAGLWSPSTGIIDSHGLMLALQADAEAAGAQFALCSPVLGGRIEDNAISVAVGAQRRLDVRANRVVNAAGLGAHGVAANLLGFEARFLPAVRYAKGNYFSHTGRPPFRRPVYPLPTEAGLGIHATVDLGGGVRFGPDVEWTDRIDYSVDPGRNTEFYRAVREYYPSLKDGALLPAFSGIRPKLHAPGQGPADFLIQGPQTHGVDGLVNLFGIESPGLTASLAIADHVAELLLGCSDPSDNRPAKAGKSDP